MRSQVAPPRDPFTTVCRTSPVPFGWGAEYIVLCIHKLVIRVAAVFMGDTNEGSNEFFRVPYGDTHKISSCRSTMKSVARCSYPVKSPSALFWHILLHKCSHLQLVPTWNCTFIPPDAFHCVHRDNLTSAFISQ